MALSDEQKINLLDQFEIGGNFFELIEFTLTRKLASGKIYVGTYGVNVAKVREVVHLPIINPLASTTKGISGIFELRGVPIPAINLNQILGDHDFEPKKGQQIIVTEFSRKRAGFIVDQTRRIRRVSWDKVLPPSSDANSCMTGMILLEDKEFLFILDLEKILIRLDNQQRGISHEVEMMPRTARQMPKSLAKPILADSTPNHVQAGGNFFDGAHMLGLLLIDDSSLVLNTISRALREHGYVVTVAHNGQEGYEIIKSLTHGSKRGSKKIHAVITDIEMPMMDGLTLIHKVRQDPDLKHVPFIVHSSLDGDATKSAAEKVGADAIVVKNDLESMLESLHKLLGDHPLAIGG